MIRWRSERHVAISFTSDASSFRWAGVTRFPSGAISVGDYWDEDVRDDFLIWKDSFGIKDLYQSE